MGRFSDIWQREVKELALACINPEVVCLLMKPEEYVLTQEEEEKVKAWAKEYRDLYGMYYISHMCWSIDHDLSDNREWKAPMAVSPIYNTLASESYWKNVHEDDTSTEEAKKLLKLRDGLEKLL